MHIGAKGIAVALELMDLSVEGAFDICCRAAGAHGEAILIGGEDGEAIALKLLFDGFDLLLGGANFFRSVSVSQ